ECREWMSSLRHRDFRWVVGTRSCQPVPRDDDQPWSGTRNNEQDEHNTIRQAGLSRGAGAGLRDGSARHWTTLERALLIWYDEEEPEETVPLPAACGTDFHAHAPRADPCLGCPGGDPATGRR